MTKANFKRGTRDSFFDALFPIAQADRNVVLVTADCGAPSLDKFRTNLSSQYITVGIAEQNMIAIAAGLALAGKKPFCYAIAPFASLRCYEQIKVDLCSMHLPVTVLGVGAGLSYDIMGPTHHTTEDISIMRALPGMQIYTPSDSIMGAALAGLACKTPGPKYVRFDREVFLSIYPDQSDFSAGISHLREGRGVCLIASGIMVHSAMRVAENLKTKGLQPGIIDLYRPAPIDADLLTKMLSGYEKVVTIEEHFIPGGIGEAIRVLLSERNIPKRMLNLGLPHKYLFEYGGRKNLHELAELDDQNLSRRIQTFAKS